MDFSYQHAQSQRVLRQRNMLGITAIVLAGIVGLLLLFSANRDREAVLLPILDGPLRVSSSGVTREYLELVTRDTAVLTLNRTPNSLDYEMRQRSLKPVYVGNLKVQMIAEYRGEALTGRVLRIENKGTAETTLTEASVAPASSLAVSIAEPKLAPGRVTTAYLVSRNGN